MRSVRSYRKGLDDIQVASPCHAHWEDMAGDDRMRFCGACRLNVYNLSAMDVEEAAQLIADTDGRLCVRFHRRADGTILTRDCPVGAANRRRRRVIALSAAAALGAGVAGTAMMQMQPTTGKVAMGAPMMPAEVHPPVVHRIPAYLEPAPPKPEPLMGQVAAPYAASKDGFAVLGAAISSNDYERYNEAARKVQTGDPVPNIVGPRVRAPKAGE